LEVALGESGDDIIEDSEVCVREKAGTHEPQFVEREISWYRAFVQDVSPREHVSGDSRFPDCIRGAISIRDV